MNSPSIDYYSSQSVDAARRYAGLLTPIPPSVSGATKILWNGYQDSLVLSQFKMSPRSLRIVKRVEKSAILKTPIYFAAMSLFPKKFEELQEDDATVALVEILGPGLFASLLALIYLHRRLNKICKAEAWEQLSKEMVLNMEVGYLIGQAAPQLGPAIGTLVGGIRFAALATFLLRDADQYSRYRNAKKKQLDVTFEHSRWGCDHGQVSGYLLKSLGFPLDALQVAYALRRLESDAKQVPSDLSAWQVIGKLIDSFKQATQPSLAEIRATGVDFTKEDLDHINSCCSKLFDKGSTFVWMFKGTQDVDQDEPEPSTKEA
ncbi:hypothetical protein OAO01_01600 [Oligoflexia bacterium]|nr:hypothetical protein [Oligoflexia bacterium]